MVKKLSAITTAILAVSTLSAAESSNINEAFTNGKISGDITLYSENVNKNGANKDAGFNMGSVGLNYETDLVEGFKASFGFRANHKFSEKEDGDYSDGTDPETVLSVANISFENETLTLIAGRQEIDLEWVSDFHEAVTGITTFIPNTTLTVEHTQRSMGADPDGALAKMEDIGPNSDGANIVDAKVEPNETLMVNPYYMNVPDLFDAYGLKIEANIADMGVVAHYASTSEDVAGQQNGSIMHFEAGKEFEGLNFGVGYVKTNKDAGVASLKELGNNLSPLDSGGDGALYKTDAKTVYVSAKTEINSISLEAIYGSTDYENTKQDKEFNLVASKEFSENISLEVLYSSLSANTSSDDEDKLALTLIYSF